MTNYIDMGLQFPTSNVSRICIVILRTCTQNKALLHKCAESRKILRQIFCTREGNVKLILSFASSKLIRPFSRNLETCLYEV